MNVERKKDVERLNLYFEVKKCKEVNRVNRNKQRGRKEKADKQLTKAKNSQIQIS